MGLLLALIAGMFIPLTNLTIRKSIDLGGSAKGYFVFQMASSFLFALLIGPLRKGEFSIPPSAALLGIMAGLIFSVMVFSIGRAAERGPPAFTFSILHAATVMPGLLMALIFGAELGFIYNGWHALGSLLVLAGLFWAGRGLQGMNQMKQWLFFASLMFIFHMLLLTLYQWKAMVLRLPEAQSLAFPFRADEIRSEWFAPFMFFTSGLIQAAVYLRSGKGALKLGEIGYGAAGGLSNILCTFFIMWATEVATSLENAIIFPIFSVVGISFTNLWGQKLYQEQVNWRACQLCAFGLIIGAVDWKVVAAAIGF